MTLRAVSDGLATYNWTGPNNFKRNCSKSFLSKKPQGITKDFINCQLRIKAAVLSLPRHKFLVNDYPAFTLPKTVTACAGTEFVFNQFVAKPLTDSTETVQQLYLHRS
ncbi:MAG: hypothetical protein U5N85_02675 [Arcicella sp.]|nr:hypothetical protein [Arcicella sp.]